MAQQTITVKAQLIDKMSKDLKKIRQNMDRESKKMQASTQTLKQGFIGAKTALVAVAAFATGKMVQSFIRAGTEVENLTTQFKVLLGSTDEARKRMKELSDFAARTPFQLKDVAEASRILQVLTQGALSTGDSLRMIGDAAAATGTNFNELAMWVGRAFDGLKSNRPIGEALMRLQELGIVTGNTRAKIENLQKQAKGKEAWKVLEEALKQNEGGMAELSKTVSGLSSTIKDQFDAAMRDMMDSGVWDAFRDALGSVVHIMDNMLKNGTFVKIGQQIGNIIQGMNELFVFHDRENATRTLELFDKYKTKSNELQAQLKIAAETGQETIAIMSEGDVKTLTVAQAQNEVAFLTQLMKNLNTEAQKATSALAKPTDTFGGKKTTTDGGGGVSKEEEKRAKEQADTILSIREQLRLSLMSEQEKEMQDLNSWYAEKAAVIGANEEAQLELIELYKIKEQALNDEYKQKYWEKEEEDINNRLAKLKEMQAREAQIKRDAKDYEEKLFDARAAAAMQFVSLGSSLLEQAAKENKEYADIAKGVSIAEAVIATALSAAKANSATPYPPVNAALMAVAIAQGLAQVAIIAGQKFAQGGIVQGAASTGDQTTVRVNTGEAIFNKQQQARLLDIADGRGGGATVTMNETIIIQGNADEAAIAAIGATRERQLEALREDIRELQFMGQI